MLFTKRPTEVEHVRDEVPMTSTLCECVAYSSPQDPGTGLCYMNHGQHDYLVRSGEFANCTAYGLWKRRVNLNGTFGAVFNTQLLQPAPNCFHHSMDSVGTLGEVYALREWESLTEFRVVAFRRKWWNERQRPEMVPLYDVTKKEVFRGVELKEFPVTVAPMTAVESGLDRIYRHAARGDSERVGSDVYLTLLPAGDRASWDTPRPARTRGRSRLQWQAFSERLMTVAEAVSSKASWMGLFDHNVEVVEESRRAWELVDPWLAKLNAS